MSGSIHTALRRLPAAAALMVAVGAIFTLGSAAALTPSDASIACLRCHDTPAAGTVDENGELVSAHLDGRSYGDSLHGLLDCTSCHPGFTAQKHTAAETEGWYETARIDACRNCHADQFEMYSQSFHGGLALGGPGTGAPVCADCHNAHNIVDVKSQTFRTQVLTMCGNCHGGHSQTYLDSYHGKASLLGDPDTAVCTDCHGGHEILPESDPKSRISEQNIVGTCAACHPGANKNFAGFMVHVNPRDPRSSAFVFFFYAAYVGLICVIFTLGGVHTGLYIYRGFKDGLYKRHGH